MPGGPGISNIPGCALQHKLLLPVFMQWPVKASFQKPRLATHCLSTTCSLDLGANLHGPFTLASFMIEKKKQYPVDNLDNFNWQLAMSSEPCGTAARGPVCFSGICLSKRFPPSRRLPSAAFPDKLLYLPVNTHFHKLNVSRVGGLTLKEPFPLFQSEQDVSF